MPVTPHAATDWTSFHRHPRGTCSSTLRICQNIEAFRTSTAPPKYEGQKPPSPTCAFVGALSPRMGEGHPKSPDFLVFLSNPQSRTASGGRAAAISRLSCRVSTHLTHPPTCRSPPPSEPKNCKSTGLILDLAQGDASPQLAADLGCDEFPALVLCRRPHTAATCGFSVIQGGALAHHLPSEGQQITVSAKPCHLPPLQLAASLRD